MVLSTVVKGFLRTLDTKQTLAAPGVLKILNSVNMPRLGEMKNDFLQGGARTENRDPLVDDEILYGGQFIALVVAETFEQAIHAASLVCAVYRAKKPALTMDDARSTAEKPPTFDGADDIQVHKGEVGKALATPGLKVIDETYTTPAETHNPIEPAATVAF